LRAAITYALAKAGAKLTENIYEQAVVLIQLS
jgi:hypothetical protein